MKNIANIITQILTYSDTVGTTDNPQLRNFDWNRRLSAISIDNPDHKEIRVPPGEEAVLFDGLRDHSLDDTSVVKISNIYGSLYKLEVISGSSAEFRKARQITALSDVNVTVNNDSVATFEFVGATLVDVVAGDTLRVAGESTFDEDPYDFSPLNSGLWRIIGVSGNKVQAVRSVDEPFSGVDQAVVGTSADQIQIYSSSGVQACDKFELKAPFSSASHKTFSVKDVTPDELYFVSTSPLPEEEISYPDTNVDDHALVIYTSAKKVFYLETDQEISVRFNDDPSDNVKVSPISAGNPDLIGYLHKFGSCYKAVVKNKSVNTAKILYFVAE